MFSTLLKVKFTEFDGAACEIDGVVSARLDWSVFDLGQFLVVALEAGGVWHIGPITPAAAAAHDVTISVHLANGDVDKTIDLMPGEAFAWLAAGAGVDTSKLAHFYG